MKTLYSNLLLIAGLNIAYLQHAQAAYFERFPGLIVARTIKDGAVVSDKSGIWYLSAPKDGAEFIPLLDDVTAAKMLGRKKTAEDDTESEFMAERIGHFFAKPDSDNAYNIQYQLPKKVWKSKKPADVHAHEAPREPPLEMMMPVDVEESVSTTGKIWYPQLRPQQPGFSFRKMLFESWGDAKTVNEKFQNPTGIALSKFPLRRTMNMIIPYTIKGQFYACVPRNGDIAYLGFGTKPKGRAGAPITDERLSRCVPVSLTFATERVESGENITMRQKKFRVTTAFTKNLEDPATFRIGKAAGLGENAYLQGGFLIRKFIESALAMERRQKMIIPDVRLAMMFSRQIPTESFGGKFIVKDPLDYELLHKKLFAVKLEESKEDKNWKQLEAEFLDPDADMDFSSDEDSPSESSPDDVKKEEDLGDLADPAPRQLGKVMAHDREDDSSKIEDIEGSGPRKGTKVNK